MTTHHHEAAEHPVHGAPTDSPDEHAGHPAHARHDAGDHGSGHVHDAPGQEHLDHAGHHAMGSVNAMAASATLHCLTGCAIGEIMGLVLGTALGLGTVPTVALAVGLAFLFGYTLSTFPLLRAGVGFFAALGVVFAADTLSILTMEVVDNAVMAAIPGAMDAGLVNVVFWLGMMIALTAAYVAAYPVNRYLLQRGKGHALTHQYHDVASAPTGWHRLIPAFSTGALAAVIISFMLGGLLVAAAAELSDSSAPDGHALGAVSAAAGR
jgi:hypothetical protein